mmetsp:Transcript_9806/g.20334  ORF Transcript_9806/g.20334 Transcript_9806/m.20334 type:complete len:87 (+) Transcript_9806:314-574(+)
MHLGVRHQNEDTKISITHHPIPSFPKIVANISNFPHHYQDTCSNSFNLSFSGLIFVPREIHFYFSLCRYYYFSSLTPDNTRHHNES